MSHVLCLFCRFPSEYFGILYGLMIILSGFISLFQYGFFSWAEASGFTSVSWMHLHFDFCVLSFLSRNVGIFREMGEERGEEGKTKQP